MEAKFCTRPISPNTISSKMFHPVALWQQSQHVTKTITKSPAYMPLSKCIIFIQVTKKNGTHKTYSIKSQIQRYLILLKKPYGMKWRTVVERRHHLTSSIITAWFMDRPKSITDAQYDGAICLITLNIKLRIKVRPVSLLPTRVAKHLRNNM